MVEVESALSYLGNPGRFHVLVFICLGLNNLVVVLNHLAMVVYAPKTPFKCQIPEDLVNRTQFGEITVVPSTCSLFINKSTNGTWMSTEIDCPGKWDYDVTDNEYTIIMQFDLVCGQSYLVHLSTTIYFIGVMLGGILFGTLSDMFGRKPFLLLTLYTQIGIGVWMAFSSSFFLFIILRFVQGVLMQGLQSTSIVLIMELFRHKYSAVVGSVFEVFWGVGVMWLALVAYLLKHWKYIQLTISLSSVVTILYIWLIPESVRWLVLQKKFEKAERVFAKAARFNKVHLPSDPFQLQPSLVSTNIKTSANVTDINGDCHILEEEEYCKNTEENRNSLCGRYSVLDMFKLAELRRRSFIQFYIWFVVTASYYGLSLRLSSFEGDRYLNFFYGGLCELPAYCASWFILKRFGRRSPLVFYLVVGGLTGIVAGVTSKVFETVRSLAYLAWIPTTMAVLSRVSMAGCFSILWLYSSELYPTVIRNMSVGACTFWMRVGAMVAPQILLLGDVTYTFLPIIIFGSMCLIGGGLTFLLPETINSKLPETLDDIKPVTLKCCHCGVSSARDNVKMVSTHKDSTDSDMVTVQHRNGIGVEETRSKLLEGDEL